MTAIGAIAPIPVSADLPTLVGDVAGLEEEAALRAGEGIELGDVEAAALDLLQLRRRAHDVVPTVGAHGHGPYGTGRWASDWS